jgi:hypothetical protein
VRNKRYNNGKTRNQPSTTNIKNIPHLYLQDRKCKLQVEKQSGCHRLGYCIIFCTHVVTIGGRRIRGCTKLGTYLGTIWGRGNYNPPGPNNIPNIPPPKTNFVKFQSYNKKCTHQSKRPKRYSYIVLLSYYIVLLSYCNSITIIILDTSVLY